MIQNKDFKQSFESNDDQRLNEETTNEISTENEFQIGKLEMFQNEDFDKSVESNDAYCEDSDVDVVVSISK